MLCSLDIEKRRKYDREAKAKKRLTNPEFRKIELERNRLLAKQRYYRRREEFRSKFPRCVECGSTERLEAHHEDPSTKESAYFWNWSEVRFQKEIAKCVALCYDCHKEIHKNDYNHFRKYA